MKFLLMSLCALALVAGPARPASAADADFELQLPLHVPAEGLHTLQITEAVYRASHQRDLADLRVFNANNEALPLAVLPAAPPTPPSVTPIELRMAMLPAQPEARDSVLQRHALRIEREGERAVIELWSAPTAAPPGEPGGFLVDARPLKDKTGALELVFAADAADYSGRVDVLGSEDLVNWRRLTSGPLARNRKLGDVIERTKLAIDRPPSFVRVAWSTTTAPAITGVRFVESIAPTEDLPRATLATSLSDDRRSLYVEVPEALPVERLFVRTPQANRVLSVRVYRHEAAAPRARRLDLAPRRAPEHWIAVGPLEVFRVLRDGQELEGPPLTLRARTGRLRIDSKMPFDEPLPVVEAEWRPARIMFAARSPGPFRLAVGSVDAKAGPLLDAQAMLPADDPAGTRLPVATILAEARVAPDGSAAQRAARIAEARWSRYLLWGVLLLAVAGLGWMAWRLSLQLRRAPATSEVPPDGG